MTIAVCLKVQDGLVFAADSAATLGEQGGVSNVYDNANKIVNLCKGKPIGAVFWGAGGIGNTSMTTLAKDFRQQLTSADNPDALCDTYRISDVAERMLRFLESECSSAQMDKAPPLGLLVGGYSSGSGQAECYQISADGDGQWIGPEEVMGQDVFGNLWRGQPEWISRLVVGFGSQLGDVLVNKFGLPPDQLEQALAAVRESTEVTFMHPAMPIQDAIDLARFFVELTKFAVRFTPGAPTVGGPTEVAAITKHEGFKWAARKHFYSSELNPVSIG